MPRGHDDDVDNRIDLEVARAQRPTLPGPLEPPALEKVGIHYECTFPGDLHFKLDHLVEHRDEFSGELTITYGSARTVNGVLFWGRVNLTSASTRAGVAKQLGLRIDADWHSYLELFCLAVVHRARSGAAVVEANEHKPRNAHQYLIDPILPLGLPTNLYGPGGVGKSTLACGLAFSVETGLEVFDGWHVSQGSAPVLILDWEGREEDWTERWQAVARGMNVPFPTLRYRACRRRLKDDVEFLAEEIIKRSIALVVVDSVSLAFGISSYAEADPADAALGAFQAIRELGDVTWLLIDHVTGANTEENGVASKAYGSVKKRDLARQMFHVAGQNEGAESLELVLTHTKANYQMRMKPQGLVVERNEGAITFRRTTELTAPELVDKLSLGERIKVLLSEGALSPDRLKDKLGVDEKDRKAREHLRVTVLRLIRSRQVVKLPSGEIGLMAQSDQVGMQV